MAKAESKPLSKVRISLTLKVAMCVTERVENGTISDGFSRHGSVPSFSSSASSSSQWSAAQISHVDLPPVPTTDLPPALQNANEIETFREQQGLGSHRHQQVSGLGKSVPNGQLDLMSVE